MANNPKDLFDSEDQDENIGDSDDTYIPPDEPLGSHSFGTTSTEERLGEGFERRTKHTKPEDQDNPAADPTRVGQLVQPGDEDVDAYDDESNVIAVDEGEGFEGDYSAEEAAMHVIEDRS
jgi:hypothetical protein